MNTCSIPISVGSRGVAEGRQGSAVGAVRRTARWPSMVRGHEGSCLIHETIIAHWYSMSRITLSALNADG